MGQAKPIVRFSKTISPHLPNIFAARLIREENSNNFSEPVLAAKTTENISQKWS